MKLLPFARRLMLATILPLAGAAQASYPERPVRLVVGFAPSDSDISSRVVAQKLSQMWGQQVTVENRPGAAVTIRANIMPKAAPDGYRPLQCMS